MTRINRRGYGNGRENEEWYDIAQICTNGHLINEFAQSEPEKNKKFCARCGEPTITNCQSCQTPINGYLHNSGYISIHWTAPRFCHECGQMYPWTAVRMQAARELVDELDLSEEEKKEAVQSVKDLIHDGPRTQVAALKFKRLVTKGGMAVGGMFKDILVDVASEAAKKILFP